MTHSTHVRLGTVGSESGLIVQFFRLTGADPFKYSTPLRPSFFQGEARVTVSLLLLRWPEDRWGGLELWAGPFDLPPPACVHVAASDLGART